MNRDRMSINVIARCFRPEWNRCEVILTVEVPAAQWSAVECIFACAADERVP